MPDEVSLRDFIDARFQTFEKRLDDICSRIVGRDKFDALAEQVKRIEAEALSLEKRMTLAERAVWLGQLLGGIAIAVVTALLIAIVSGKIQLVWH